MRHAFITRAAALGLAVAAQPALAATAVSVGNTTGQNLANPPKTLGYSFTANSDVGVTALGFFDDAQDGLINDHLVGIWSLATGLELARVTVPAGTSAQLVDKFRYAAIPTLNLAAGQSYLIGAFYSAPWPTDDPVIIFNLQGLASAPEVTIGQGMFASDFIFRAPTSGGPSTPYIGPNFQFGPLAPVGGVPEPRAWALMIAGFALLGTAIRRRRRAEFLCHTSWGD